MSDIETTAPVEPTPVAAIVATPEPESTAEQVPAPEGESPEAKPERTFTQAELNKIVQKEKAQESRRAEKLAEARLRAEYAERQLAELKAPPAQKPSGEPVPGDFKDYESYIAALTDFKVDQRMKGIREETEAQQYARQKVEQAQKVLPKLKSAQDKYDDFNEVATSYQAPPAMQAAMLRSAHTGELYYYLGANVEERERISRLDDIEQVYAIRDLETKLTASSSPTRTPAPIEPNSGKAPVSKHFSDIKSQDEWDEYRRKRLARKR